jgi:hypothetical protein
VPPTTPTLDAFYDHILYSNPFAINRVVPASLRIEDAQGVHQKPFARLVELAGEASRQHTGLGVMLWGEAGIGKSHLLARLAAWAGSEHKHAIFVYLANLQAEPEQLPRSLLRCVMSILTLGRTNRLYETPLYRLVNAAIRHALQDDGSRTRSWNEAERAYTRLVDDLCSQSPAQAAVLNRQVFEVLFHFFRSAYLSRGEGSDGGTAALAVRWLSGDSVDVDEAKALGLSPGPRREEGVALTDDLQVQNVLVALARVASYRRQPLILCFDQVDTLEPEQFSALARFLHALLDGANNLLVITSGVRAVLTRWEADAVIPRSTWERLALHEVELQRVNVGEARQIVQARLQPFQEPFVCLGPVKERVTKDYLFPLGDRWAEEFLTGKLEVRPRDVINWAREGWRRQQDALKQAGGSLWLENWEASQSTKESHSEPSEEEIQTLIDAKVTLKLLEHKRQRQLGPQTLPPDGDNLAGLLHSLLQRCLGTIQFPSLLGMQRLVRPKYGQRPPYDLVLRQRSGPDGKETRSGLLCLVVSNRTSMSAFLRRLIQDTQPPERLFLIADERRPLDPAAAGREYLEKLQQRHGDRFVGVTLTFDQYAELDALQATVGLAKSGDLEIELPAGRSRRVAEPEVVASHLRQQRYSGHPLLRLLLDSGQTPAPAHKPLTEPATPVPVPVEEPMGNGLQLDIQDLRQFIMGRLAITMGASSNELAVQYRDYLLRKQVQLGLDVCKSRLEEVARGLHQEGHINATPHDDYLYLLSK